MVRHLVVPNPAVIRDIATEDIKITQAFLLHLRLQLGADRDLHPATQETQEAVLRAHHGAATTAVTATAVKPSRANEYFQTLIRE